MPGRRSIQEPLSEAELEAGEPVSRAEFDQMKGERDQLLDRMARMQAEFDNARKRAERERVEFRDIATGNVVEQFLPVIDNFQLALNASGNADQLAFRCGAYREADGRDAAEDAGHTRFRRWRTI